MKNIRKIINNPYLKKLEIYFNTKYDIIMNYFISIFNIVL